jgi:hypothetical protein
LVGLSRYRKSCLSSTLTFQLRRRNSFRYLVHNNETSDEYLPGNTFRAYTSTDVHGHSDQSHPRIANALYRYTHNLDAAGAYNDDVYHKDVRGSHDGQCNHDPQQREQQRPW